MKTYQGIGASAGYAIGSAFFYSTALPVIERKQSNFPQGEIARLTKSVEEVDHNLQQLEITTAAKIGEAEAEVFGAHRMFLSDPSFITEIQNAIKTNSITAECAVLEVGNNLKAAFEAMEDDYFRARAADIVDVSTQIIRNLLGINITGLDSFTSPVVVVADELNPSDTARMEPQNILGFITRKGGKASHAAILARSLGIPAVVGAGDDVLQITTDTPLLLDGSEGCVIADADETIVSEFLAKKRKFDQAMEASKTTAHQPAITLDGVRVEIVGNIGSNSDAERVIEYGGEGVGLLRTEFLFLDRKTPPTEAEQLAVYQQISNSLLGKPLIIRTLDIGGDKPLPYINLPLEDNPFLGVRGLRLCLQQQDIFIPQLRAILQASATCDVKIMFPMVTTLGEILQARQIVRQTSEQLTAEGKAVGSPSLGIMVEVPAAAVASDLLAREVDFFSIGTNDLTQYTLAADRGNPGVQHIADHFHPAVLRLIRLTINNAHRHGKWVGICGELAGELLAAPLLLGMHLDEFSMGSMAIPAVKNEIRQWSVPQAEAIVEQALNQPDAETVRAFLASHIKTKQDQPR